MAASPVLVRQCSFKVDIAHQILGWLIDSRHTFVAYSENITMTNLDMNATSNSQWSTVNTDGVDTWNSKNIVISNWTVTCGDVSPPDFCLSVS
jgi:hypothetical protein